MNIRVLTERELPQAMQMVWEVFQEFEAPDYSEEGIRNFQNYIQDRKIVAELTIYGAFTREELTGVLALRGTSHISLFFVKKAYHRQGIGKALFRFFIAETGSRFVTVNSSPYALEVYRRLGFAQTDREQVSDGIRYIPMEYRPGGK